LISGSPRGPVLFDGDFDQDKEHYWVHVAIDRLTGQVIDKQIEVVNE
jgi:hypothetical protein